MLFSSDFINNSLFGTGKSINSEPKKDTFWEWWEDFGYYQNLREERESALCDEDLDCDEDLVNDEESSYEQQYREIIEKYLGPYLRYNEEENCYYLNLMDAQEENLNKQREEKINKLLEKPQKQKQKPKQKQKQQKQKKQQPKEELVDFGELWMKSKIEERKKEIRKRILKRRNQKNLE